LKKPDTKNLISGVSHRLCFKSVPEFPFGYKGAFAPPPSFPCVTIAHLRDCARAPRASAVGKPVCAICAFSIMPEQGCMKPPPGGGAPPRGHRDGPLSSLTAHRRAEVPTTMVFFLKDVTRTPCASACEGRVGKDLVTLLRLDAHAAARRYDMPCSPEPAPGACVCRQTPRQRCTCI
jgi:hypothetical protein